ncbi:MAG: type IV-A pilus assembly ATPase PilB [Xanthomonadales bacterium]|nr:type IV-A pilus assembly ATPase PilB [Gammaproteobacteria bacterium]MBT8052575.1 type IV-A pilus assembly ATPase PilB [Gammaproteobacteria bacterium]NND56666.1 type IV-A pilus assembly ATPase PilB [Xanthomonadales bacterium]NNK52392.1 type IV-A pilus assembly ATPase PilB [Xanthomonadales bacterium]
MNTELKVTSNLNGLARRLVEENILDAVAAENACTQSNKKNKTLLGWLIKTGAADAAALASAAAEEYGIPLIDIAAFDLNQAPIGLVSEALIEKHQALPLHLRGNQLFIGMKDPTDHELIDEIAFSSGFHVEPILIAADQVESAIQRAMDATSPAFDEFEDEEGLEDVGFQLDTETTDDSGDPAVDETPVVRFINKVLLDAIRKGASDIHFEPYEARYRIRYRLDGVLKNVAGPPIQMSRRLSSRLKVMAGLDIAEKRVPQDGRIKLNLSRSKSIDFRASTCPTLFGEKVVLRILDSSATKLGIEQLGFDKDQQKIYYEAVKKPYGMVLSTGPTGSGKTVSLYTALQLLNDEGRNISTVEDPVEIRVHGINQVQQNTKQGMTFARALRAFLRQDPDVIMVGEIRDIETAEIAIKAAQTGHLVLSTLHTNDAPQSITRLMNMGVPSYNITSAVNIVVAQRLLRTLHTCKKKLELPPEALLQAGFQKHELEDLTLYQPGGCSECNEGYRGRTGIFEVMPITDDIARIILEEGNALRIAEQARKEGIIDLRQSALNKVSKGITDLIEINRVTKD